MEETEIEPTGLLNKKPADLTVGDNFKVGLGIAAIYVAVPVALVGVGSAVKAVKAWRQNRKADKAVETIDNPE